MEFLLFSLEKLQAFKHLISNASNGHSFFHSIFLTFSHHLFQSTKFVKAFIVGLTLLSNMQHVFSSTKEMVSIRTKKGGFSKLKKPLRIKTSMKATLRTIKNHTIQQRSLATTLGYHKPSQSRSSKEVMRNGNFSCHLNRVTNATF